MWANKVYIPLSQTKQVWILMARYHVTGLFSLDWKIWNPYGVDDSDVVRKKKLHCADSCNCWDETACTCAQRLHIKYHLRYSSSRWRFPFALFGPFSVLLKNPRCVWGFFSPPRLRYPFTSFWPLHEAGAVLWFGRLPQWMGPDERRGFSQQRGGVVEAVGPHAGTWHHSWPRVL